MLFFVAGSTTVISDECSARTWVIVICSPSGFTRPPLPKRTAFSGGTQPRSTIVAIKPAGPSTGAPVRRASSAASHDPSVRPIRPTWSPWPWVTRITSTLPSVSRFLYCCGVFGFPVRNGSMTITLPVSVVSLVVA